MDALNTSPFPLTRAFARLQLNKLSIENAHDDAVHPVSLEEGPISQDSLRHESILFIRAAGSSVRLMNVEGDAVEAQLTEQIAEQGPHCIGPVPATPELLFRHHD